MKASIVAGAVLTGRVASVREFGAFIDLGGGVQGLLHISEMGWSRVSDPSQLLKPGDEITVKVLQVDEPKAKISLGLKQLSEDPWSKVAGSYEAGQVHEGRITRVAEFGAFIELEPGVEALAHASTFAPTGRPHGWKAGLTPGTAAQVEILSVDPETRRIGVKFVRDEDRETTSSSEAEDVREYARREDAAAPERFGSLADKLRGAFEKK